MLNPFPAKTTDVFVVYIGIDNSPISGIDAPTLTLIEGEFSSCSTTFNPKFTNTSGELIVTIDPRN